MTAIAQLLGLHTLENEAILITGASSGIGEASARLLAPLARRLFLVARRQDRLEALQRELGPAKVAILAGDLTQVDFREELKQRGFFGVDILINNAGLARGLANVAEASSVHWQEMIDLNITAAFAVVKHCLPYMQEQQRGHIVNLTSIAAHHSYARGSVYCASKAALLSFAQALRSELCAENIRVSNISPGMTETEFSLVRFSGDAAQAAKVYDQVAPLTGLDIARQIVWALAQPPHINLDEIYLTPLAQGEIGKIARKG